MSQIESNAIPFVKPMIEGQAIKHGKAAQEIVSAWLTLRTLMAFSATERPWPPVVWQSFDWVYSNRSIPPNWHVWLAKYYGSMPAHYETQAFQSIGGQPTPVPGIMMTSVLGYLAYKVVGLSGPTRLNYRENVLVKIAPRVRSRVEWPPDNIISDNTIIKFYGTGLRGAPLLAQHWDVIQELHQGDSPPPSTDMG